MGERLFKLRPDRDLQCYFEQPSAIAALSGATESGFTVSGTWRQQFDWCVVEWNRDNQFEHPAFRNLPDGNLSGLTLIYEEVRENCVPLDSGLYAWVDWPNLRVWVEGRDEPYKIPLRPLATAVEGEYAPARAEFELTGNITPGDYVGLSWRDEQYNHLTGPGDTLASAAAGVAAAINAFSTTMRAECSGARITLIALEAGANQNRIGAYGFVSGARTEQWTPGWSLLGGGGSPTKWRIEVPFGRLQDLNGTPVPTQNVRKLRWTYAAEMQPGAFERSDFAVHISNWRVAGEGAAYEVAGPLSRRIENEEAELVGDWEREEGNYSGGSLHRTAAGGAVARFRYRAATPHRLYLGAIRNDAAGTIEVSIDGADPAAIELHIPGEEVRARVPLGEAAAGTHLVSVRRVSGILALDFLEIAVPEVQTPDYPAHDTLTLATDWDTEHSLAVAPERSAWMIDSMGFRGRVNHYAGAMWFYELTRKGHEYASVTITFEGVPEFGALTTVTIGRTDLPGSETGFVHLHRIGDTAETVARALALKMNEGATAIRAEADGAVLRVAARAMGEEGNKLTCAVSAGGSGFTAIAGGTQLSGGRNGDWLTDLQAAPRLNRAARDWHRCFFTALRARGLDVAAAFSMELRHGDPSVEAGIAQRCPDGDAVIVNTPALQTNFSPESRAFWRPVYREMADLMAEAGLAPYIQFGEIQWWYFRDSRSGMPYYDAYTLARFRQRHGRELARIEDTAEPPTAHPEEIMFLSELVGEFTEEILAYVRESHPSCRAEVLYPLDVNESEWNSAVNYACSAWTAESLDCLKTESFGYTYARDLNRCRESILYPLARNFPRTKTAHLTGIGDARSPWKKEAAAAVNAGAESVVLFALDQFCLIGYTLPVLTRDRQVDFQY